MRVQIAQPTYRTRDGREFRRGDVVDLDDAVAVKLLGHGIVVVAPKAPVESASVAPPANAAARTGKAAPKKGAK